MEAERFHQRRLGFLASGERRLGDRRPLGSSADADLYRVQVHGRRRRDASSPIQPPPPTCRVAVLNSRRRGDGVNRRRDPFRVTRRSVGRTGRVAHHVHGLRDRRLLRASAGEQRDAGGLPAGGRPLDRHAPARRCVVLRPHRHADRSRHVRLPRLGASSASRSSSRNDADRPIAQLTLAIEVRRRLRRLPQRHGDRPPQRPRRPTPPAASTPPPPEPRQRRRRSLTETIDAVGVPQPARRRAERAGDPRPQRVGRRRRLPHPAPSCSATTPPVSQPPRVLPRRHARRAEPADRLARHRRRHAASTTTAASTRAVRPGHHHRHRRRDRSATPPTAPAPTATTGTVYTGPITIDKHDDAPRRGVQAGATCRPTSTRRLTSSSTTSSASRPTAPPPAGWPSSWGTNARRLRHGPRRRQQRRLPRHDQERPQDHPHDLDGHGPRRPVRPATGIYANPSGDGATWERPASARADQPRRHQGLPDRRRPAHPRRLQPQHEQPQARASALFFRGEYGDAELDYPALRRRRAPTQLRRVRPAHVPELLLELPGRPARHLHARPVLPRHCSWRWASPPSAATTTTSTSTASTGASTTPTSAPEANYGATYFGGKPDDYDVIKVDPDTGYNVEATDGNLDAWTQPLDSRLDSARPGHRRRLPADPGQQPRRHAQPRLPGPARRRQPDRLHAGRSSTAATSTRRSRSSSATTRPNNFFAIRNRNRRARASSFFAHDAEHTLLDVNAGPHRPVPRRRRPSRPATRSTSSSGCAPTRTSGCAWPTTSRSTCSSTAAC